MGFVRFLQGYYILLIKSRKRVAMVGQHCIYKIIVSFEIFVSTKFYILIVDKLFKVIIKTIFYLLIGHRYGVHTKR